LTIGPAAKGQNQTHSDKETGQRPGSEKRSSNTKCCEPVRFRLHRSKILGIE
jgi:hypothetical protein